MKRRNTIQYPKMKYKNHLHPKRSIKALILALSLVVSLTPISALDMCEYEVLENTNCTMITPEIDCNTYDYTIINTTNNNNNAIEQGTLTQLNDTVYYFNFSQPTGDYIIRLCDGSTREIKSVETLSGCTYEEQKEWGLVWLNIGLMAVCMLLFFVHLFRQGILTSKK